MEARPQGRWNELRDKRQLVALDVSGDQQGLRLLGFDAALLIQLPQQNLWGDSGSGSRPKL